VDAALPILQGAGMLEAPAVRYLRNGGVSLAYQVVGDGPIDLVEVAGTFTHLEAKWEEPGLVRSIADLSRFARVIMFDRRGVGLSDHSATHAEATLDELVDDLRAVIDAVGAREVAVLGVGDGGMIATAFAAAYPERTRALILYNTIRLRSRPILDRALSERLESIEREWGTGVMATLMGAEGLRPYFARVERRACTPHAAAMMVRARLDTDLSDVLPALRVPTLILHYRDHPGLPVSGARDAAAEIAGARYIETPGYSADGQVRERRGLAAAIEEFLTGRSSVADVDRVLAAVLFTDIVGSTERAAELGDRRWRDLLDEHDRRVCLAVEAAAGRFIKSTGDGVLACFDGAARAVRCAQALVAEAKRLGIPVRAGVHVGECERRGDDIGGMTVHVAARVLALAGENEVLATSTVREALVGTDIGFDARGTQSLRGVPGTWSVFAVQSS
jgi:class 3 adenylate cyclase